MEAETTKWTRGKNMDLEAEPTGSESRFHHTPALTPAGDLVIPICKMGLTIPLVKLW